MKINIVLISVGKIRETYIQQGVSEYEKRLSRFCQMQSIIVDELSIPEACQQKEQEKIKLLESIAVAKKIPSPGMQVCLDVKGKSMSSEQFSQWLYQFSSNATMPLVFMIGGSLGLNSSLLQSSQLNLSLSPMTFPHTLFRLIFLEQLYRAFKIMHGEKYHK